jgi:hypothetical protein
LGEPQPTLTWRHHPFVERPRTSALVTAGLLASWWLGWHLLGPFGLVLAVFATVSPLGPYLFPTEYRVGPEGPSARSLWQTRRFRWDEFVGYDVYADAVQLVLDPHSLRNRVQKGLLLPLGGVGRERLLPVLEHYLPTQAADQG